MLLGLGELIRRWKVLPHTGTTVLAQVTQGAIGHNALFYVVQIVTLILLALAANTSFGGLPVLAGLLARDNFLPHVFGLRADRQVYRYGVGVLAVTAGALLVVSRGSTQALVPLFAVGVFVGFTLSQVGMVRHWATERPGAWPVRAGINGFGAVLTLAATFIELISKFTSGAWLVALVIPSLVVFFRRVHRTYVRIGDALAIGQIPPHPVKRESLVIVPVGSMSRLTSEGINAALALGDDVQAVTVVFTTPDEEQAEAAFHEEWRRWRPEVPLVPLRSYHRSLGKPIVSYLRQIEAEDHYHRLVVLIPEVQPGSPWQWVLHNQRGAILERAIRHGTDNVVTCRLRFRLDSLGKLQDGSSPGPHRES
jgi:hypothetical protein